MLETIRKQRETDYVIQEKYLYILKTQIKMWFAALSHVTIAGSKWFNKFQVRQVMAGKHW